jgi:asparagine synthase (glutamine-hydrolysing)
MCVFTLLYWPGEPDVTSVVGGDSPLGLPQEAPTHDWEAVEATRWQFDCNGSSVALSCAPSDPNGWHTWEDGTRTGVVAGAVTNLDELGVSYPDVFGRLLDGDRELPAAIEGSFLVVCYDGTANRWVIATDKLGARPCFYTRDGRFRFADSLAPLVAGHPDPTVDRQAVSDMLLMGHLWGDRTLVEEVKAMRPATVLEVENGDVSTHRYWRPTYEEADPGEAYLSELARRYRQAVERSAGTLPREAGLWLSGGLDSRTTAAALCDVVGESGEFERLRMYTYDANPPTNDNPRIASRVAERLGLDHHLVPLTAERFAPVIERVIEATDGMIQWNTLVNLSATHNVEGPPPVMLEGMQGELVGDHPFRYHLDGRSAVESQYASEASATPETVSSLLVPDVDPLGTFREEAGRSPESTNRRRVLDAHFQNYYSRNTLFSNKLMRDRVGSRVVQADGEYLDWCARLPRSHRKGTFPLSHRLVQADAGGVPYGTSRAKLELCRRIAPETTDVTYERTKVSPGRAYPFHVAGFVGNVVVNRLRGKATYGSGSLADFWIRDRETGVHGFVAGRIDDACDRPLFDGDAVRAAYESHMDGANKAALLARITTLEQWFQTHLDG